MIAVEQELEVKERAERRTVWKMDRVY